MMTDERLAELVILGDQLHEDVQYIPLMEWMELCAAVRIYKSKLQEVLALADDWSHTGSGWEVYDQAWCDAYREAAGQVRVVIGELE